MEKINLYGAYNDLGDGEILTKFFLSKEDADKYNDSQDYFYETAPDIETFVGSTTYLKAVENSKNLNK